MQPMNAMLHACLHAMYDPPHAPSAPGTSSNSANRINAGETLGESEREGRGGEPWSVSLMVLMVPMVLM